MSKIYRSIKNLSINLIEFVYDNTFMLVCFTCIYILLLLSILIKGTLIYNILYIIYNVIAILFILGWIYNDYKKDRRIKQLDDQLNSNKDVKINIDSMKYDLAILLHSIWSEDIINNSNSSDKEIERANIEYSHLSEDDKAVNYNKADRVIKVLKEYIF